MIRKMFLIGLFLLSQTVFGVVNTIDTVERFAANGSSTAFTFTFRLVSQTDLTATVRADSTGVDTELELNVDYTLAATNNDFGNGGILTTTVTYASGNTLILERDIARTQTVNLIQGQSLPPEPTEQTFDKQTMAIQDIDKDLLFMLSVPKGDPLTALNLELPDSITRASRFIFFDATGSVTTASTTDTDITITSYMETLLDDADASTAQATLALKDSTATLNISTLTTTSIISGGPFVDVRFYDDFAAAVTAISSTETTLLIPTSQNVAENVSVPSTLSLMFLRGGDLDIDIGFTVTIAGDIEGGQHTIFTGVGTVTYNGPGPLKYGWFGTGASALTDAIASLGTGSRKIILPGGDISFSTTAVIINKSGCIIEGQGRPVYDGAVGTRIIYTGTGVGLTVADAATSVVLKDFQIQGEGTGANGIKIGGGVGVHQTQMKNIAIDDFTGVGLEVDFLISGCLESVSVKACGTGVKIVSCFMVAYKDFNIVDSDGIGLSLEPGAAGEIAYSSLYNFAFTGNGFEAVNIGGSGGIRNNVFDTFQMETSQQDGTRTNGFYHWLVTSDGYTSKVVRNTIKNVVFSNISNLWDGTTGNRCLKLQGGRWYIENLNSEATAFTGRDVFVATSNTLLNLGNITERELSRWDIPVTVEVVGKITPIAAFINVSVSGDGAYETLATFTITKNTTGGQTDFGSGIFYEDDGTENNDLTGGASGIHIIVHGIRVAGATAQARIQFGGNTVAEVDLTNDGNNFIMETWIWNVNDDGLRHVTTHNTDGVNGTLGAISMIETSGPTVDPAVDADITIDGFQTVGAGLTIKTVFIERF